MDDVKKERESVEGSPSNSRNGKRRDSTGSLTSEERNRVLVKLVTKERVLDILKETMSSQSSGRNQKSNEEYSTEPSEINESEGDDEVSAIAFTKSLPPSAAPSPSPSPSPLPTAPSPGPYKASFLNQYPLLNVK